MTEQTQPHVTQTGMVVDPKRFDTFDKFLFRPFEVKETRPLSQTQIDPDRDVLVAEIANGVIVLDKAQMSYYHTAQGQLAGQPWLVCF